MSKPWFAFSKRAAAFGGVRAIFALIVVFAGATSSAFSAEGKGPEGASSLPERTIVLSNRGGQELKVGDTVSYSLADGDIAAESRWKVDPKESGLKFGFLFRAGRLFTPLAPGELSLPPLAILDEQGAVVAHSKPLVIKIESNFSEKDQASGQPPKPEPALGPMGLPFPAWIQSLLALVILGVVLVAVFFIVRYLKRKAAAALKKVLPKKSYDQLAIDRIDSLLKQGLIEKGKFKPLYFGISEILKFYLGERFNFDAQESTTSELLNLLNEQSGVPGLNADVIRRISTLFTTLDPVKFADLIPSKAEAGKVLQDAREIIVSTRKVAVEPILKEGR
jgi:hypothetical protein